ncbi:hypothetical protein Q4485_07085 [Granulosicoccaceae sp. 1_MG-2023]|nr:hypothetical protein [Granulosicoccaceae sp. 1_MG-2023]
MKILFVSRRNNQARYFRRLSAALPFASAVHILGSSVGPVPPASLRCGWRYQTGEVVATQLRRRANKYPRLAGQRWLTALYGALVAFKEKRRYARYHALLTRLRPASLGLWNGKKLPTVTIVAVARDLGVPVWFFENGLLPATCSLDHRGVNADSSLPREAAFYLDYRFAGGVPEPIAPLNPRAPVRQRRAAPPVDLPARFLFVPFQVPDDTQIVCHSPWIGSMEALFEEVMRARDALGEPDLKVVFKEHPSWPGHFDHLYQRHPDAVFANGNATPQLIERCEALLTINSTVGLEGLQLGKKVLVLGQACYRIDGLVLSADSARQLADALKALPQWQADQALRHAYLRFLNEVYCIPQKWSEASDLHFQAVARRLAGEDAFRRALGDKGRQGAALQREAENDKPVAVLPS